MDFNKFCEAFPKAGFVKIINYNEEEAYDEAIRKKNKAPLNSLKDPLNIAQAKNWLSRGGRLGWIVPKGYIAIDIDNKDHARSSEVIEKLLDNHSVKYVANKSKKGMHFIFGNVSPIMAGKSEFQGRINHIGIGTDGRGDKKGYIILPANDEKSNREWYKWDDLEIDDLPFWLRPLRQARDTDVSFIDMPDGSGNEALFKLRGAHTGPNLVTEEESIECLRIINWEIWEDPMTEEMFNATVARPVEKTYGNMEAQDGTGKAKKPVWLEIARKLIADHGLIAVGDYVYQFKEGIYVKLTPHQVHELVHKEGFEHATKQQRKEIIEFVCVEKQINPKLLDKEYACISVKNGYLDLLNLKLIEPTPNSYNTVKVDIPYNPNCQFSERINEFMKFISKGDAKVMQQLYELAGYCLIRRNNFHKFFVLVGGGGTGKSTYTNLIRKMFNPRYVSTVGLSQFDQDYHLSTLTGAMVNIDDDASSEKVLRDAGRFKSIVAGQPVLVRAIYSEPILLECMATVIVCANSMVKIHDDSEGLYRRLMLVELNNKIKEPDRNFDSKITDLDMEYFLCKSVEAMHGVLKSGKFVMEESEEKLKQRFKVEQSSINKWCQLQYITVKRLVNRGLTSLFVEYKTWTQMMGYHPFNYGNFVQHIVKEYKLTTHFDIALNDQIVIKSLLDEDYCPFSQSLASSTFT
jgi:P4 family phage/plasmid primase-like protien